MNKIVKWFSILSLFLLLHGNLSLRNIQAEDKINVLFLGTDSGYFPDRPAGLGASRSDAIMILTLDPDINELTISTIPRDTLVDIPGYGPDKVNHAFAFGGTELSVAALQNWLGIEFDHYLATNMAGYVEIIDYLGGIVVVPPTTFNWTEKYAFVEGQAQELNGDGALAYARERYTSGGDYARQGRMREMVSVVIKKLIADGNIEAYRDTFENRNDYIYTDLTFDEILAYFAKYGKTDLTIKEFQLYGNGVTDDVLGYIDISDPQSLEELLQIVQ